MTEKKAKTAREALLMAADLLSKRGAWCRGTFARTATGHPIGPKCANASSWCVYGALIRVSNGRVVFTAIKRVAGVVHTNVVSFNDHQKSKQPVIAALRKAAEL